MVLGMRYFLIVSLRAYIDRVYVRTLLVDFNIVLLKSIIQLGLQITYLSGLYGDISISGV